MFSKPKTIDLFPTEFRFTRYVERAAGRIGAKRRRAEGPHEEASGSGDCSDRSHRHRRHRNDCTGSNGNHHERQHPRNGTTNRRTIRLQQRNPHRKPRRQNALRPRPRTLAEPTPQPLPRPSAQSPTQRQQRRPQWGRHRAAMRRQILRQTNNKRRHPAQHTPPSPRQSRNNHMQQSHATKRTYSIYAILNA